MSKLDEVKARAAIRDAIRETLREYSASLRRLMAVQHKALKLPKVKR